MGNSLKKGMISVLLANIISLLFGLITNFILPKYLSIDSYSAIKTYQLYIIYIGILHFGYEDGMYLKYGGKRIDELNGNDIRTNLYTLRIFQIIVTACMVIIALILKDKIFLAFSFAILPINLVAYFKLLYQALGEFEKYGRVMNLTSIVTFIINILLVFVFRTDNYTFYIAAYVVWSMILWIGLEMYLKDKLPRNDENSRFSFQELTSNIKLGLPLTLGNFSSVLITSIDRWFVKFLMETVAFAQYSFAVSTESFINVALTPIIVTLYNYFCKHSDINEIKKIRNCVMIFASLVVSCAFGAKFILEVFLQKYMDASNVLFLLFASQIFYVTIKGVYVNMYKAQRRQKEYFKKLMFILVLGVILSILFYFVLKQKEAFALGTLLSAIFWLIISCRDFKGLEFKWNEITFLVLSTTTFLGCGIFMNSIIGFVIYILAVLACAYAFLSKDLKELVRIAISMIPLRRN